MAAVSYTHLDAEGDSRTITELVRRIRKKIADYSEKEYIETVWGLSLIHI